MANELTDLDLKDGEFSICFADLGGAANEECTIEIVKSKSGLVPILKETDMSDKVQKNDEGEGDADFETFASENGDAILSEFNALSAEDQAEALVGLTYENAVYEGEIEVRDDAIAKAAEMITSLSENVVPRATYEELKKSTLQLVEKMKKGEGADENEDVLTRITKSLGGEASIPDDVRETLTDLVKAKEEGELKDSVAKAKTYGFGKAEDVAGLETRIRKGKTTAKDADIFVSIIKQAGQLAKSSPMFKPLGENAVDSDANSPIVKAKDGIEAIQKSNPNLTYAQASSQYWAQNPDAYRAMREHEAA